MASKGQNVLSIVDRQSHVEENFFQSGVVEILRNSADADGEYQVIAHMVNELKMGWYKNGQFIFWDGSSIIDKYLLQLRVFNTDEEILLKKTGASYWMRKISDVEGQAVRTVDSTSTIFGSRIEKPGLTDGFEMVYEPGRKVKVVLPVKIRSEKYSVTTRSYVSYDEVTGQAGYGYYRYVVIEPERR